MANDLLTAAYNKCADVLIATQYQQHSLKVSDVKFRLYTPGRHETWAYQLQFEKSFDFGYGNWKTFNFNSKEALGKFLFETMQNNGMPKGATGIVD